MKPIAVTEHNGILVLRDDLIPGGTKSRFLSKLFSTQDEIVYASTACGGAQLALAYSAKETRKQATLFVAKRKELHPRTMEAITLGATIYQQQCGYPLNLQARAREYCETTGAYYVDLGCPEALETIAETAAEVYRRYGPFDQVWSAAGSGVLTRGIQEGIPDAQFFAVRTGRKVTDIGRAVIHDYPLRFQQELTIDAPFPSCPNIDRKAWDLCSRLSSGTVLFWNVLGPSPTPFLAKYSR